MDTEISKEDFYKLGKEWTDLDIEYDNLFQEFLNKPQEKNAAELERFKSMQKRLYTIENNLYKVAEGRMRIRND